MNELDRTLFLAFNGAPTSSTALVALAIVLAKYVILIVPMHMTLVWVGGDRPMRYLALTGLLALVLALVVNQLIGFAFYRPRPFLVGLGHAFLEHRASSSLPSNHATVFFVYAAALALFSQQALALAFAGLGLLVAWSRVFLGIHYPLDMVAAAATSGLAAYAAMWVMSRHGWRIVESVETVYLRLLDLVPGTARFNGLR